MRDKAFVSMAITTIIYSIIVLIGLILRFSLLKVFLEGLLISAFTGISVYILITGIERYLGKNEEIEYKNNDQREGEISSEDEADESIDDFSPLNPPEVVLEKETPD
ncbi:MAG: hypothetical protein GX175_01220 [Halanaerobiaceae bacterium]|jgi:hypothetical protein|nr:hypothetical protein [Halanaerobiaceae bacterium]